MIREKLDFFFFVLYSYYTNMTSRIKQNVWYRTMLSVSLCLFHLFFTVMVLLKELEGNRLNRSMWWIAVIASLLITYLLFIPNERYLEIYNKYKDSPSNNARNRKWCWFICALVVATPYVIIIIFRTM